MEFFRIKRDIPFMRYALVFNVISLVTFLAAVTSLATKGLHFGVDFTGGTVMEVQYEQPADLVKIRESIAKLGLTDVAVQNFGTARDVLIRLPLKEGESSAKLSDTVLAELGKGEVKVTLQRVEFVGPQVGAELVENGALADVAQLEQGRAAAARAAAARDHQDLARQALPPQRMVRVDDLARPHIAAAHEAQGHVGVEHRSGRYPRHEAPSTKCNIRHALSSIELLAPAVSHAPGRWGTTIQSGRC